MLLPPVVALEVGTTKVRALVGEGQEGGPIMLRGLGECLARGVRKGEIVHFDNALASVRSVLAMAEEQSQVTINQVHLLVAGGHVQGMVNSGTVPVVGENNEITQEDTDRAIALAKAVSLPHDREILHSICQHFSVDGQPGILNPVGMEGLKLTVDVLVLHAIRSRVRNAVRILKSAHVEVQDVAFSGLCAGLAVLTPAQKESGVIVIDLGGGTTSYIAYADECIAQAGCFAIGGDHITNDIALGMSIPLSQAERLKVEAGNAVVDGEQRGASLTLVPEGGFPGKFVRLMDLHTIINARLEELLNMIKAALVQDNNLLSVAGAGVVLTGGGARLKNVTILAEQVFGLPCTVGMARDFQGEAAVLESPEYAAPLGMLRYAIKSASRQTKPVRGLWQQVQKLWRR